MRILLKNLNRQGFAEFIKRRGTSMLVFAFVVGFLAYVGYLASTSVAKVIEDAHVTRDQVTELISRSDRNGKALDCILEALGTGESIKREVVAECKQRQEEDQQDGLAPVSQVRIPAPRFTEGTTLNTVVVQGGSSSSNPQIPQQQSRLILPGNGQGLIRDGANPLGIPLGQL